MKLINVLAIDDQREHPSANVLCRTYEDAIKLLEVFSCGELILDHDLGCYEGEREKTGYDILLYLEDPENLHKRPNLVYLCTDNSSALGKMASALESMGYKKIYPSNQRFFKRV